MPTFSAPFPEEVTHEFERQRRNRDDFNRENMQRYIDPRIGGLPFSGADFQAIVFLPMSQDGLEIEIVSLKQEAQLVRNRIERQDGGIDAQRVLVQQAEVFDAEIARLEEIRTQAKKYIRPIKLFDIQTITISSHREKFPVRTLGRVHPKSYTRGPRTLAGSMIFTLFNKHALWELVQAGSNYYSSGVGIQGSDSGYPELNTVLVDQLPPFDITLIGSNELGDTSYAVLYGVEIVNDGRTLSIQDIITESVVQFVCRDFEDLRPLLDRRENLIKGIEGKTRNATDVVTERLTEQQRRRIRLNPFV